MSYKTVKSINFDNGTHKLKLYTECISMVGWGKMSMVGQSRSDDVFVSTVKAKKFMITG